MDEVGPLVTSDWLAANLERVHLFDSRSYLDGRSGAEAFGRGHLPGAVFVSLDDDLADPPSQPGGRHPFPSPQRFAAAMSRLGYDGSRPAVVYDDVGGGMAGRLWFMLRLLGLPAAVLDGGIQTWEGPLETGPVQVAPATFAERPWPGDRLVDADEVARLIDAGGVVIDARNPSRYAGKPNRIDPRFGHIPGAVNRAWEDNIDDLTARMQTPGQLAVHYGEVLDALGEGERPIVYCGSGVTACHDLIALELLGVEGRLYVGSWSEWGADESRPVATLGTD